MPTNDTELTNTENAQKQDKVKDQLPALLTIKKAAEVMGVSRDFMYKALKKGDLPTAVIGGKRWILRDPLLRQLGCIPELKEA
mgnify:CR=1 FL=1